MYLEKMLIKVSVTKPTSIKANDTKILILKKGHRSNATVPIDGYQHNVAISTRVTNMRRSYQGGGLPA